MNTEVIGLQGDDHEFFNISNNSASSEGSSSGPAKIRRAIEHLRTDVVKGLGVKLLDKVLEIMDEEDEVKKEVSRLFHIT